MKKPLNCWVMPVFIFRRRIWTDRPKLTLKGICIIWRHRNISAEVEATSYKTTCSLCGDTSTHYHPNCPQCYGCGYNITPEQKQAISRIPNVDKMLINRNEATVGDLLEESGIDLTPSNETLGDMLKRNGL